LAHGDVDEADAMITEHDLDEVRERLKALRVYDHEGYSGPSANGFTVSVRDGRFFVIGAADGREWWDDVESVVQYMMSSPR
jgi:hypothetical protein